MNERTAIYCCLAHSLLSFLLAIGALITNFSTIWDKLRLLSVAIYLGISTIHGIQLYRKFSFYTTFLACVLILLFVQLTLILVLAVGNRTQYIQACMVWVSTHPAAAPNNADCVTGTVIAGWFSTLFYVLGIGLVFYNFNLRTAKERKAAMKSQKQKIRESFFKPRTPTVTDDGETANLEFSESISEFKKNQRRPSESSSINGSSSVASSGTTEIRSSPTNRTSFRQSRQSFIPPRDVDARFTREQYMALLAQAPLSVQNQFVQQNQDHTQPPVPTNTIISESNPMLASVNNEVLPTEIVAPIPVLPKAEPHPLSSDVDPFASPNILQPVTNQIPAPLAQSLQVPSAGSNRHSVSHFREMNKHIMEPRPKSAEPNPEVSVPVPVLHERMASNGPSDRERRSSRASVATSHERRSSRVPADASVTAAHERRSSRVSTDAPPLNQQRKSSNASLVVPPRERRLSNMSNSSHISRSGAPGYERRKSNAPLTPMIDDRQPNNPYHQLRPSQDHPMAEHLKQRRPSHDMALHGRMRNSPMYPVSNLQVIDEEKYNSLRRHSHDGTLTRTRK